MKWLGNKGKADERAQHYDAGVRLAGEGQFEQAVSEFKQALKIGPSSCDLYWQLGAALIGLQRWKEALNACNKAIKIDPFVSEPWRQLGTIHDQAGNFVEA